MISDSLAASLARRNIHYGWVMVGVTFLTALVSAGVHNQLQLARLKKKKLMLKDQILQLENELLPDIIA